MQIEIKMDPSCTEPKVIITTASITEEVSQLMKRLSEESPSIIAGFRDDKLEILNQTELIRIYANAGKVFAVTGNGEYCVRSRLYELEERLDGSRFVRISNSEIVNLSRVTAVDLSLAGTICKPPSLRSTPLGRVICDMILAVNRRYGRADYLPCIAWGSLAYRCGSMGVGDRLSLEGRLQSRIYTKEINGQLQERTAFEVSVMSLRPEYTE